MITRRSTLIAALAAAGTTAATASIASQRGDPLVQTRAGPVIGFRHHGVNIFKGLRYGAPTRRFQPPQLPQPWTQPVRAVEYGAASPQGSDEQNQSEDCLFLNIWSPGLDAGNRPVMVYIHGGAYSTGSGSSPLYDGTRLAQRGDVVVVTLNHRLNVFGYAYLARLAGAGDVTP